MENAVNSGQGGLTESMARKERIEIRIVLETHPRTGDYWGPSVTLNGEDITTSAVEGMGERFIHALAKQLDDERREYEESASPDYPKCRECGIDPATAGQVCAACFGLARGMGV